MMAPALLGGAAQSPGSGPPVSTLFIHYSARSLVHLFIHPQHTLTQSLIHPRRGVQLCDHNWPRPCAEGVAFQFRRCGKINNKTLVRPSGRRGDPRRGEGVERDWGGVVGTSFWIGRSLTLVPARPVGTWRRGPFGPEPPSPAAAGSAGGLRAAASPWPCGGHGASYQPAPATRGGPLAGGVRRALNFQSP